MPLPTPPSPGPDSLQHSGILNNSSQFTISGGSFQATTSQTTNYNVNSKIGLMELYHASMPEAAHDSSARKYVPKCYPGTREQHIQDFTLWASNNAGHQQHRFRMSWMEGPLGVGKSTIAQTCAEKIRKDLLGAAFFFSRPNQRDDPDRFFPSIAYQVSTKVKPLADILDQKICNDPSVLTKTMEVQFQELIVLPFLELKERGEPVRDMVVIIDGLDECRDDHAQCEIIKLIATAVRDHRENLPFVWAFFSRPEPHIVQTFSSETISPLVWMISLPVSREIDEEIELYIRGQFKNIQKRVYHVPAHSNDIWPSEFHISALVHKSAGLFVYASTTMKYIGAPEALDPKDRLEEVVFFSLYLEPIAAGIPSPTAEIDSLYTLIMRCIPPRVLTTTQQILLLLDNQSLLARTRRLASTVVSVAAVLGLSVGSVMFALSKLHSVLAVDEWSVTFHHASFMEFLKGLNRSGPEFCITQPQHYGSLLKRALELLRAGGGAINYSQLATSWIYSWIRSASIDDELALLFARFNFTKHYLSFTHDELGILYDKLPPAYRDQVIQRYRYLPSKPWAFPMPMESRLAVVYTLGQGEKSIRYEFDEYGRYILSF